MSSGTPYFLKRGCGALRKISRGFSHITFAGLLQDTPPAA